MMHECCSSERWDNLPRPVRFLGRAVLGLLVCGAVALVFGYVAMWLWNAVVPQISSLPAVTFWQAVALLVLARLFTGRFSHGHHRRFGRRHASSPNHYAEWWETEGEAAYAAYLKRGQNGQAVSPPHE